jgi:ABC-type glycerol-3-phosphate transport system permease component
MQGAKTGSHARPWRLPGYQPAMARFALHATLAVGSFVVLLPIIWALSASLKGPKELFEAKPSLLVFDPTLANYEYMWTRLGNVPTYFANSFIVSLGAVALVIVAASLAGYAFARLEFRGRDALFLFMVLMLFVPRSGGLMALYELMSFLHLRNNLLGLILLFSSALSVPVFIMRQTFLSLPREVEEAARIDGAGWLAVFRHIAVPLAAPGMVIVAIFTFIRVWGDFLVTLTMIDRDAMMTIAVGVRKVSTGTTAFFSDSQLTGRFSTYGADAAIYLMAAAPVVVVWIVLQRWFMRGLTEGVMKF